MLNGIKREKKCIASHGGLINVVYAYQHKRSSGAAPTTLAASSISYCLATVLLLMISTSLYNSQPEILMLIVIMS